MKKLLICSAAGAVLAFNKDESTNTITIAVVGHWKGHIHGEFDLTVEDLKQIKTNFDNSSLDVVIDLDHATLYQGTGEAYGWIKELEVVDEKLQAKVEWLESGKELIESKKYKYISPVLSPNTIDEETGNNIGWTLHSAALTNRPFFEDLGEIKANNKSNTKEIEEMKKTQEELEQENETLKDENQKLKDEKVEAEVDAAITANKVSKEQKDSLIALGKANPEELTKLLAAAKPSNPFGNDGEHFAGSNNGGGQDDKYDVLALGGFNS
ncbi:phage protease [Halarcobacter sp.]|uniref:phage protease n=1 Tax=Halarcobacter sp. TaxID=2321133 RepID=UPI0029F4D31A|nr:phage protease [Halarcobacter sp.]